MGYGLRQFGMLHHVAYHQRLDRQKAKPPDEFAALLLDERLASVGYALVDARDDLTLERPLFRAFWGSGKLALSTGKRRHISRGKSGDWRFLLRSRGRRTFSDPHQCRLPLLKQADLSLAPPSPTVQC